MSDTLFSRIDVLLESDDCSASRVRTAASGNPLYTIVDRSGVFEMEVIFCICPNHDNPYEQRLNTEQQLLQSGLLPATFKQIETLFTFSVLDDYITDNLECKTTAQQYYSKLQITTSKMFPNSVPVCFSFMVSYKSDWCS
jgi:hypothetical protein